MIIFAQLTVNILVICFTLTRIHNSFGLLKRTVGLSLDQYFNVSKTDKTINIKIYVYII